ncbi:hypothetical protein L484_024914 [Morus notabilis]|uniref:Uncharacterized protein n=1 Tax=Morus notabilis TaxID=981085 RepID=W9RRS5_9ROSA|nr:hypothetical protein L484_024914 [Morus notabilis]
MKIAMAIRIATWEMVSLTPARDDQRCTMASTRIGARLFARIDWVGCCENQSLPLSFSDSDFDFQ